MVDFSEIVRVQLYQLGCVLFAVPIIAVQIYIAFKAKKNDGLLWPIFALLLFLASIIGSFYVASLCILWMIYLLWPPSY